MTPEPTGTCGPWNLSPTHSKLKRSLISGYSLFGEATPRLVHPFMSMSDYTKETQVKSAMKYSDVQGRPQNMFYFSPVTYSGTGYSSETYLGSTLDHRSDIRVRRKILKVTIAQAIICILLILQHLSNEKNAR